MSRLIWVYAVCKSLLLSPMAVKELIKIPFTVNEIVTGLAVICPTDDDLTSELFLLLRVVTGSSLAVTCLTDDRLSH